MIRPSAFRNSTARHNPPGDFVIYGGGVRD
jgi:hypothetical protein